MNLKLILLTLMTATVNVLLSQDLDIKYTNNFDWVWDDRGSGAIFNGTVYKPKLTGYHNIGYVVVGPDQTGGYYFGEGRSTNRVAIMVKNVGTNTEPAIKPAIAYFGEGTDSGSGADFDVSWWLPVAPLGYTALGHVFSPSHSSIEVHPSGDIMCIRNDYITGARGGIMTYSDRESGASDNLVTFEIIPKNNSSKIGLNVGATVVDDVYTEGDPPKYPNSQSLKTLGLPKTLRNGLTEEVIRDIIDRRGPILYLHKDEPFEPMRVEDFIANTSIQTINGEHHFVNNGADFEGNINTAESYVSVEQINHFFTDIHFWFFYGHNGNVLLNLQVKDLLEVIGINQYYDNIIFGSHTGDWEHVTLRVDNNEQDVVAVKYSSHGDEVWYEPNEAGHIKVFSALRMHGTYPDVFTSQNDIDNYSGFREKNYSALAHYSEGSSRRVELYSRNICSEGGKSLDASQNFTIVASNVFNVDEPYWVSQYRDHHWGEIEEYDITVPIAFWDKTFHIEGASGPSSPKFLGGSYDICLNKNITIDNSIETGNRDYLKSSKAITASNIIYDGAEISYLADNGIILKDGFHAKNGSIVTLSGYGCSGQPSSSPPPSNINFTPLDKELFNLEINFDSTSTQNSSSGIIIHPNPNQGIFNITLEGNSHLCEEVQIISSNGNLVFSHNVVDPEVPIQINISNELNGTYFGKFIFSDHYVTKQIIKE